MGVSDEVIIVFIGILFNYLVLYKRNKMFGNLAYIALSFSLFMFSNDNITASVGLVMIMGSFVHFIYDIAIKLKNR